MPLLQPPKTRCKRCKMMCRRVWTTEGRQMLVNEQLRKFGSLMVVDIVRGRHIVTPRQDTLFYIPRDTGGYDQHDCKLAAWVAQEFHQQTGRHHK